MTISACNNADARSMTAFANDEAKSPGNCYRKSQSYIHSHNGAWLRLFSAFRQSNDAGNFGGSE